MDIYIEDYTQDAKVNSKILYTELDSLIDSNVLFLKSIKMAKSFHCSVSSLEESMDKSKLDQECAENYKKHLQSIKNSKA